MAFERTIHIAESHALHVRGEFFNLTNTANFNNPASNVAGNGGPIFGAAPFGIITSTSNNPRIIQLALKYQF